MKKFTIIVALILLVSLMLSSGAEAQQLESRRIFTVVLTGTETMPAQSSYDRIIVAQFIPEEDVTIIGVHIKVDPVASSMLYGDGAAVLQAELTPAFTDWQPMQLGCAHFIQWQKDGSIAIEQESTQLMFPVGYVYEVRAGEVINLLCSGTNTSRYPVREQPVAEIFYVKGIQ